MVLGDVVVGGQQEAAGAAAGSQMVSPGVGAHDIHDGLDQRARGEVLARAALGVLGVLLQQAFVDFALDVDIQADPGFAVDQVDQAAQLGRVLDLVLGLAEDDGDQAGALAQLGQDVAVVGFERHRRPGVSRLCQSKSSGMELGLPSMRAFSSSILRKSR